MKTAVSKVKIVSLQDQGKNITEAFNGEIGIKFSDKISKTSQSFGNRDRTGAVEKPMLPRKNDVQQQTLAKVSKSLH